MMALDVIHRRKDLAVDVVGGGGEKICPANKEGILSRGVSANTVNKRVPQC